MSEASTTERTWPRRAFRITVAVLVGAAGAWTALLLAGRATYQVGPFEVEYLARPGRPVTEIALPPLGRISATTHRSPIHLTATVASVDPDRANEILAEEGVRSLVLEVEREGTAALRRYVLRAIALAVAGGLALGFLVYRARWRSVALVTACGALVIGAATGTAWATYNPAAFQEPTYSGSLRLASQLVGPVRQATQRLEDFRAELDRLVRGTIQAYGALAGGEAPSETALKVLHISDIHASPLGMDFAQRLAESFQVQMVIDTGDMTSFGTPLEETILERIPQFEVPYVFVRGNHDSTATGARIATIENAIVLDNSSVNLEGLTIYGAPHPLFTPDPQFDLSHEEIEEAVVASGDVLLAEVEGQLTPPDVVAVHDERMALALAGEVPLVLSGHFHRFASAEVDGTVFLQVASTGGGGLDTFVLDMPIPLGAEILYFEGDPPRLVAFDRVELDPETRDITVERKLASSLEEEDADPAPSPSP